MCTHSVCLVPTVELTKVEIIDIYLHIYILIHARRHRRQPQTKQKIHAVKAHKN